MKFTKKTLGIVALSAALIIPVVGVMVTSQLGKEKVGAEDLSDEEFFASHYKGLTASEVARYVGYLDEIEKLNVSIDKLITEDGEIPAKNREKHNQLTAERDHLDKEVYFLEKKSWLVEEKERVNEFTNIKEELRQSLLDNLTVILDFEEKLVTSALTDTEKDRLDSAYREYVGEIFYFDKSEEIEKLDGLTQEEKNDLLESYLKVNELNQKIAHLEYDEYYEIVPEDQEKYERFDVEITDIYENEIKPLEEKAGIETFMEPLRW